MIPKCVYEVYHDVGLLMQEKGSSTGANGQGGVKLG